MLPTLEERAFSYAAPPFWNPVTSQAFTPYLVLNVI